VSKAAFLADVRSARAELREILAHLDARTLADAKVPGMDWTAKDVLSHLVGYDLAIRNALAEIRAGQKPTWPWSAPGFDAWNERKRRSAARAAVRGRGRGARGEPERAAARARGLARGRWTVRR